MARLTTSAGKLMFQQLGSFAEFERNRHAERVLPGMIKSVQQHYVRCKNGTIKADLVEGIILSAINDILDSDKLKDNRWFCMTDTKSADFGADLVDIQNQLKTNREKQLKLTDLHLNNLLSEETFKQKNESLRLEEEKLRKKIAKGEEKLPSYFIKTYGCQMNVYDSQHLAGVLETAGYQDIKDIRRSDIVLVNTCCVRKHAEDRAFGFITSLKNLKVQHPTSKIIVCGCIPEEEHIDLKKMFPFVDLFMGPNQPEKLAKFLGISLNGCSPIKRDNRTAYITIMHGCNNFCSYCVVPYVRGREYSRPIEEILEEIRNVDFTKQNEIVLLGQNVNSYEYGLAKLLKKVSDVLKPATESRLHRDGSMCEEPRRLVSGSEPKIRFLTSHPRDMSDEIIDTVAELDIVEKFFHLPIQHGDDEILKLMNRGYTVEYYKKLVEKIRSKIPNAAITTDVIVGFPGETEEQFQNMLRTIKEIKFDGVIMTAYSLRPQTAAAKLPGHLSEEVKRRRLAEINQLVKN